MWLLSKVIPVASHYLHPKPFIRTWRNMTPQSRAVVVQKNGKRIPSKNGNIEMDPLFIYFFMLKVTWTNKHKHSKSEKASHMI